MNPLLRLLLLSTVCFAPDREGGSGGGGASDEIPDVDGDQGDSDAVDQGDEEGTEDDQQTGDNEENPDGDGEADGDGEDDEAEGGQQAQGGRANQTIRTQRRELRELRERVARMEGANSANQNQPSRQQQSRESDVERQARLSMMTPEERMTETLNDALARNTAETNRVAFQLLDTTDKTTFDAEARNDPLMRKLAPDVETKLTELRGKGQNLSRMALFTYMVGERALKARQGTGKQKRLQARERVNNQQTRGGNNGRSDTGSNRGRNNGSSDRDRRLENAEL